MKHPLSASLGLLAALLASATAHASGIPTLQEITISTTGQDLTGVADTASEGTVTARQLPFLFGGGPLNLSLPAIGARERSFRRGHAIARESA